MTSIFIDGNIVAILQCRWQELPPCQPPCGLGGSCLPTGVEQKKVLRYIISFDEQPMQILDGVTFNNAVDTLVTHLCKFPPTSKIGMGCFLYGAGPMCSRQCKNRNNIRRIVVSSIIMVRDMFTGTDMSREEQGDPALDVLFDHDYYNDDDSDSDDTEEDN